MVENVGGKVVDREEDTDAAGDRVACADNVVDTVVDKVVDKVVELLRVEVLLGVRV